MQTLKFRKTAWLFAVLSIAGWATAHAQTNAIWTGPSSGGDWNTGGNWSTGVVPGYDANATTNAYIGLNTNVTYAAPMSAASFGILTNNGILNVNASGFNCSAVYMVSPAAQKIFNITGSGAAVTVFNNFNMGTNAQATLAAGASLTVNSLVVAYAEGGGANNTTTFTNNGGTLNANSTYVNNNTGTGTGLLVIKGGVNNLGNTAVSRYHGSSASTLGTEGLAIYGGAVTMTNLNLGNNSVANSYLTAYIDGGIVTNFGSVFINQVSAGRYSRLVQAAGLFVVPDPGIVYLNTTTAGAETARYQVTGGTNIVGGFVLGNTNSTVLATVTVTVGGTVFVGSQGIATNGVVTNTITLNNGGIFGATADWTGSAPMNLSSSSRFTFQAADMDGTPHNITLAPSGVLNGSSSSVLNKTGGGALTLGAANTYSGATLINEGTLVLGTGGSLASSKIIVGSDTTFDVSAVTGGFVLTNQTLSGSGVVTGAVSVATGATIDPGSNTLTGTLSFSNSVTETGGAINHFDLVGAPDPNNDLVIINGDLDVSGSNSVDIAGASLVAGANYVLFRYGGNFNGDITNLTLTPVSGNGTLTNDATAKTISFIPQATLRGATNTVWIGNPVNTNWDIEVSTNWLNASSGALDIFVPGDSVQFTDAGASNSPVNIVGVVQPTAVLVNSQSNYVFASTSGGWIDGTANLTVTNTGTLTILTTNTYSGSTTIDGGSALAVSQLANINFAGAVGYSDSLVINNGTFIYTGPSVTIDRGATLGTASSAINVSANGNLTLGGNLLGSGSLTKTGNGTLILNGASSYAGLTTISNGTLQVSGTSSLGANDVNFAGGTLTFASASSQQFYANVFNVPSTGTLICNGGNGNNIIGDSSGHGSITGTNTSILNIKVSSTNGILTVNEDLGSFAGTIRLTDDTLGTFRFNSGGSAGGAQQCTGGTNLTLDLGNGSAIFVNRNGGNATYGNYYLGALAGGTNTILRGAASSGNTSTYNIGFLNNDMTYAGVIQNGTAGVSPPTPQASAAVFITKVGTGKLTLLGQNTYSGNTVVSNGVLALAYNPTNLNNGSIGSSAIINVISGAALNVSGRSDGTLPLSGQQLRGRGTVQGILDTGSGLVSPGGGTGGGTGILTVTGNITLNGSGVSWMKINRSATPNCDQLNSSGGNISYGGTLVVTNIGPALQAGDKFTLFTNISYVGGAGSFTQIILPAYYTFDTSQLGVDGSVTVTGALPFPKVTTVDFSSLSSGAITINTTNGIFNTYATVIASTNLSLPFSSWTVVTNNIYFDNHGDVTDPNSGNPGLTIYVDPTQTPLFIMLETTGSF